MRVAKFLARIPKAVYNICFSISFLGWLAADVYQLWGQVPHGWDIVLAIFEFLVLGSLCGVVLSVLIGALFFRSSKNP